LGTWSDHSRHLPLPSAANLRVEDQLSTAVAASGQETKPGRYVSFYSWLIEPSQKEEMLFLFNKAFLLVSATWQLTID